jgi:hypothetical protein
VDIERPARDITWWDSPKRTELRRIVAQCRRQTIETRRQAPETRNRLLCEKLAASIAHKYGVEVQDENFWLTPSCAALELQLLRQRWTKKTPPTPGRTAAKSSLSQCTNVDDISEQEVAQQELMNRYNEDERRLLVVAERMRIEGELEYLYFCGRPTSSSTVATSSRT